MGLIIQIQLILIQIFNQSPTTEQIEKLKQNITTNDALDQNPPITLAKIIKIYDGDTMTIGTFLDTSDKIYKFSVRLAGIDTPELQPSKKDKTQLQYENEKKAGYFVRDLLRKMLMGKFVILKNIDKEKYGRVLAELILYDIDNKIEKMNINEQIIENKLGVKQDGGTKNAPDDWWEYVNSGNHTQEFK